MATDAEITLKFTAEIQEALKAIRMLRDEIEKIKAAGGFLSPEDMELISEMKAKLDEYTRTVRELQIEYYRLQQRSGEMSAEFIAQVTNLRKQLIELQDQMSNLNDKLADQGVQIDKLKKKVKELQDSHKKTEDNGVHAYRSLRTAIGHFIVNLAKGKLAVNELGLALKGLAYSTVILAAIQAAMDGLRLAWDAIKGVFGQSEEAMEEAKRKAEEAEEQLKQTKDAAIEAENAVREAKRELANEDEQNALKQMIDESIISLREEKRLADDLLDTINKQAEAEAVKRALAAEQERHEFAMKRLQLDRQRIQRKLDDAQYRVAVEQLDFQERESKRTQEREELDMRIDTANKREDILGRTLNDARIKANELEEQLSQYLSDKEIEIKDKKLAALKTRQAAAVRRFNELDALLARSTSTEDYQDAKRRAQYLGWDSLSPIEQQMLNMATGLQNDRDAAEREIRMYGNLVDQQEQELSAAKGATKQRDLIAAQLKELKNQIEQLVTSTEKAKQESDKLAESYGTIREGIDQRGEADWEQTQERIDNINEAWAAQQNDQAQKTRQKQKDKKDKNYRENKQRQREMRELAADIAEKAQEAAVSSTDTDDKAVLDRIRKAKEKYGAVFDKVLAQQDGIVSAVEMLQANTDRNERTLKELKGRIDKLVKQGKIQDTRSRKRSRL